MVPAALPRYRHVSPPPLSTLTVCLAQVVLSATILAGPTHADGILLLHYGLAVLLLPDFVARVAGVSLSPAHRLWIAGGIALHPFGALFDYYDTVWWWDHLAHTASASLLAAGLYACWLAVVRLRAGDGSSPRPGDGSSPRPQLVGHVAVFALVLAGGVGWEVFEAHAPALVVYGPTDTRLDLLFDVVGWALVAAVSTRVLSDVPAGFAARLDTLRPTGEDDSRRDSHDRSPDSAADSRDRHEVGRTPPDSAD